MDSPRKLYEAAQRYYHPPEVKSPLPVWRAETWERWAAAEGTCKPESEAVWLTDELVKEAALWTVNNVGIAWVEFPEFGARVAKLAGKKYYGAGEQGSEISFCDGRTSIVASVKAHGTGKNLQMFSANLFTSPPTNGVDWEQTIGRTHRQGQMSDTVTVDVWQHTQVFRDSVDKGSDLALFIQSQFGTEQKLVSSAQWIGFKPKEE